MKKLVIYRDNSAFQRFVAPVVKDRTGVETKVFPEGTPSEEIAAWATENKEYLDSMKAVYTDYTCAKMRRDPPEGRWQGRYGPCWGIGGDMEEASYAVLGETSFEEQVSGILQGFLSQEAPEKVFLVKSCMGDHYLFGKNKESDEVAAEKLRIVLEKAVGQSVTYWNGKSSETGVTWVVVDRHFKSSLCKDGLPSNCRIIRVPIENLIEDAMDAGIDFRLNGASFVQEVTKIVSERLGL